MKREYPSINEIKSGIEAITKDLSSQQMNFSSNNENTIDRNG